MGGDFGAGAGERNCLKCVICSCGRAGPGRDSGRKAENPRLDCWIRVSSNCFYVAWAELDHLFICEEKTLHYLSVSAALKPPSKTSKRAYEHIVHLLRTFSQREHLRF